MKKFLINYSETFSGSIEVEAETKEQANDKICEMIDSKELIPSEKYDRHEVIVRFYKKEYRI